ncbi:MAG: DUF4173 domain-containing protein [Candidatus Dojkabacteria bacterium]|nr:DUF4173 domain-containing protein [Candidatus Dojkabacteria bacterium]MDQ7021739.1 DUF4173 domain-containing protein [Candidatus Dojkabacteria bacterium]
MNKFRIQLITVLLFSILSSLLLVNSFNNEPSFALFLFSQTSLVVNIYLLKLGGKKLNLNLLSITFLISYILFSYSYITNTKTHILNSLALIFLISIINISLTSETFNDFSVKKYFSILFNYIPNRFTSLPLSLGKLAKENVTIGKDIAIQSKRVDTNKFKQFIDISIKFTLIGIPILLLVLFLLSIASDSFKNLISNGILKEVLNSFKGDFLFSKYLYLKIIFIGVLSIFIINEHTLVQRQTPSDSRLTKKINSSFNLGISLLLTVFLLNIFYIIFSMSELKTDFGDIAKYIRNNDSIDSFSMFAVSRFKELIMVSCINIAILIIGSSSIKSVSSSSKLLNYIVKINLGLFLINSILLLVSVYQRLDLFISTYGFSYKRFSAFTFLPVVLIITLLVMIGVLKERGNKMFNLSISILILYFSLMNMLPTGYIINYINQQRAESGSIQVLDPSYSVQIKYSNNPIGKPINFVKDYDGLLVAKE